LQDVNRLVCDCLKWKYKGNSFLEAGNLEAAIDAYDNAIGTGVTEQEGVVLQMRATAFLQRAARHKKILQELVDELVSTAPPPVPPKTDAEPRRPANMGLKNGQQQPAEVAEEKEPTGSSFRRLITMSNHQFAHFRPAQFRHGLYQYALLQAAKDSLRATQLLPASSASLLQAGECLSELWKLKESTQYYERAMVLEPSLTETLKPVVERLRKRQDLLDRARSYGWSEDTLRLALDVTI
jgi:tetratricopeptide (TPR) repeat protein